MTQSAPSTARPASASTTSAKPSSRTRASVSGRRVWATMVRAMPPFAFAARAIELPISPTPIRQSRSKRNSAIRAAQEGAQRLEHHGAFLGIADGDAEALRQAIGAHGADDQPARLQRRIRRLGALGGAEIG